MGHFLAVGSLSPQLRDLLDLAWTPRQERLLRKMRLRYFPAAARARAAANLLR